MQATDQYQLPHPVTPVLPSLAHCVKAQPREYLPYQLALVCLESCARNDIATPYAQRNLVLVPLQSRKYTA